MIYRLAPAIGSLAITLLSAGSAMSAEPSEIEGSWRLVTVDGKQVSTAGEVPGFSIEAGGISGYDGCNRFSGPLDDPAMMIMSQRACASDRVMLPLDLADPAADLAKATLDGDNLVLPARGNLPAAAFQRAR